MMSLILRIVRIDKQVYNETLVTVSNTLHDCMVNNADKRETIVYCLLTQKSDSYMHILQKSLGEAIKAIP